MDNFNNDKITYEKFKNEIGNGSELSSINYYKELQSIAGSLGLLSDDDVSKEVLYANIEKYLLNLESIPPITEVNPFNKQPPELLIQDNLNATELPFWKVFRNKSIFNEIFSNFTNKRLKGYYDLQFSTYNLILNNYSNSINIIIDNIKSNNYFHQIINNEDDIKHIISQIKDDNQETRSFYNLLFSTYSSQSTSTKINFNFNIDKFIICMIDHSNTVALDQFIKYFKIDKQVVKECLKTDKIRNIKSNMIGQKLDIINYLFENDYIAYKNDNNDNSKDITFWYLISILFSEGLHKTFNNVTIELKYIFKCFNLLVSIHQKFKENSVVFFDKIEIKDKLDKLLLELNGIITTSTGGAGAGVDLYNVNKNFTNDQLNTSLIDYIDSIHAISKETISPILPISKHKEIIYKMFESIILFDTTESKQIAQAQFYLKDKEYLYNLIKLCSDKNNGKSDYFKDLFEYTFRYSKSDRLELVSSLFKPSYYDGSCKFKTKPIYGNASNSLASELSFYISNIVQSNDLEIIDFYCKNVLRFGFIIYLTQYDIKSKEVLEYYISNFQKLQLGGDIRVSRLKDHLIEHYEQLKKDSGKVISIGNNEDISLTILNRIIINPSMYSGNIGIYRINDMITHGRYDVNYDEKLLFILSNIQLKQTLNIDAIIDQKLKNERLLPPNSIIKFLFKNISKESISIVLNKINFNNFNSTKKTELKFTTKITTTTEQTVHNENNDLVQYEYESFIISKPTSITFSISMFHLIHCLYYLDRSNDIIYLINTVPEILETDAVYSSNDYYTTWSLYQLLSTHYLQLFINYFIDNLNEITIKHLYKCLCDASLNGNLTLFKLLISTQNYYDYLFKIKTESNYQSLFNSESLIELVKISTNLNLKNLLLKYINFSENHLKLLK